MKSGIFAGGVFSTWKDNEADNLIASQTEVFPDALEQALHDQREVHRGGFVHHTDRGPQYVSITDTERPAVFSISEFRIALHKGQQFR